MAHKCFPCQPAAATAQPTRSRSPESPNRTAHPPLLWRRNHTKGEKRRNREQLGSVGTAREPAAPVRPERRPLAHGRAARGRRMRGRAGVAASRGRDWLRAPLISVTAVGSWSHCPTADGSSSMPRSSPGSRVCRSCWRTFRSVSARGSAISSAICWRLSRALRPRYRSRTHAPWENRADEGDRAE